MLGVVNRSVLHVDMDAFFASIEQRDRPVLRGLPVLVGGDGPRGVVATASYEARKFGCHSAQPIAVAKRLCPEAVIVRPRGGAYREASEKVFEIFHEFTPLVQPLSVDEAFLDVSGCERLHGPPLQIARAIQQRIAERVALTASIGVAPNKFLAKLGSELDKPAGITVIDASNVDTILPPLSIRAIPGIGPAAEKRLEALGIRKIADVRQMGKRRLVERLGDHGARLFELAHGRDGRAVVPDRRAKSISQECTFPVDVADPENVWDVLRAHVESVARRLRRSGVKGATATVKIRYGAFETITRSHTLPEPTDGTRELMLAARRLFRTWARRGFEPVRLIGFGVSHFRSDRTRQLGLFPDAVRERDGRLDRALDDIQERFGGRAIGRGTRRHSTRRLDEGAEREVDRPSS